MGSGIMSTAGANVMLNVEEVMAQYADMVYRLAVVRCKNKYDADDVFQEVFLRLVTKAPVFESEEHLKAWLVRVTINCTANHFNSAWSRKIESLRDTFSFSSPEKSEVFYAVHSLPLQYRTVIHLYYYGKYTTAEIAELMHMNESTVRTHLRRAREKLKTILEGDFDHE